MRVSQFHILVLVGAVAFTCLTPNAQAGKDPAISAAFELFEALELPTSYKKTVGQLVDMQVQQSPQILPFREIMLNFFKKKPDKNKEEAPPEEDLVVERASKWHRDDKVDACIIYYVTKEGETCVDVELSSYEEATINNFCLLLGTIGGEDVFLETLEMV